MVLNDAAPHGSRARPCMSWARSARGTAYGHFGPGAEAKIWPARGSPAGRPPSYRCSAERSPQAVPPAVRAQRQAVEAEGRRLAARFLARDDGAVSESLVSSEELAWESLEWLMVQARPHGNGIVWTGVSTATEPSVDLYSGTAGVVLALLEAYRHSGDERWASAAAAGGRSLGQRVDGLDDASLYFGATGVAVALEAVAERLGDASAHAAAVRALAAVREAFDGERWGGAFELMAGNAGVALGALRVGDVDLAELAVTPYLSTVEPTEYGVTWENRHGQPARRHHISHGTLGVAYALAATAAATGRSDLMELCLAAVADVVARNDAGSSGFLVPHSDPQQQHERIERYSYGWCHGPAGDAQVFRLLGQITGDATVDEFGGPLLADGGDLGATWPDPARLLGQQRALLWHRWGTCTGVRPEVTRGDGLGFADVLVADLVDRATRDAQGVRWSNVEHRDDAPDLEPRHGWAMGNAGIVRELLRHARPGAGEDPGYAADWPDHPPATAG